MTAADDLVTAIVAAGRDAAPSPWAIATIVAVEPGGAADGFAAVTVDWDGARVRVGYGASYTPVVGHVVWMGYHKGQPMIIDHYVGGPFAITGPEGIAEA